MAARTSLLAIAAALAALAQFATAAGAAPTLVGNGRNVYAISNDGNNLYWTDTAQVTKIDVDSGTSTVIFRASSKSLISDIESAGGTLAFVTQTPGKHKIASRAYVYAAATGVTRTAGKALARTSKGTPACGSTISLGRVTSGGEALVIHNSYVLDRKVCKKPLFLQSDVSAVGPSAARPLFTGRYTNGNPLVKLGLVLDADLNGDTLLSGFAIGTLSLSTNQFVLVAPQQRNALSYAQLDQMGNVLLTRLQGAKYLGTFNLINAESGYSAVTTLEGGASGISYDACGAYLMRSKFDQKRGQTSGITVLPNPLKPDGLAGSTPLELSTQSL